MTTETLFREVLMQEPEALVVLTAVAAAAELVLIIAPKTGTRRQLHPPLEALVAPTVAREAMAVRPQEKLLMLVPRAEPE